MRRLFIGYVNGITVFDYALHRLIHKSFVATANKAGERHGLWFSGYRSLVWPCTNSAFARLVRGYKWLVHIISFVFMHQSLVTTTPSQRNLEDFDFVPAVPHSNHHTVGAASWQNNDSSPPQTVFKLHSNVCLGLSNPYISSALWRQR